MTTMARKPHHYIYHVWVTAKKGYDNYAWIFFIGAIGTILGAFLKLTSAAAAVIIAFVFFYLTGRFHTKLERAIKRQ